MARPLRVQYEGTIYHLMNRGDRRQMIFHDEEDRQAVLRLLERVCMKTGWQVHAYVLMGNHFHLVVETPQPNLCVGMKWFLSVHTQAFNRRHGYWGHLFGGRYKAQPIDERDPAMACDYVPSEPGAGRVGKTRGQAGNLLLEQLPGLSPTRTTPRVVALRPFAGRTGHTGKRKTNARRSLR